jgi:hypothetical protein
LRIAFSATRSEDAIPRGQNVQVREVRREIEVTIVRVPTDEAIAGSCAAGRGSRRGERNVVPSLVSPEHRDERDADGHEPAGPPGTGAEDGTPGEGARKMTRIIPMRPPTLRNVKTF